MIRPARKEDAPEVIPILMQILNDMELDAIKTYGADQIADLLIAAFASDTYRYGYLQTLVYADDQDRVQGICVGYPASAEVTIDDGLKPYLKENHLPEDTQLFHDQEAWAKEWYLDSLAVAPDAQGQGIGGQLLDYLPTYLQPKGETKISLNVDFGNPKAKQLYLHHGFEHVGEIMIGAHHYEHLVRAI